jgi:hypothetical protein
MLDTHAYTKPSQYIEKTLGCYLIIKTTIYTEDTISIVIRRHRTVINNIYRHHPILGNTEEKHETCA